MHEYLFDHFDDDQHIIFRNGAFVLHLLEEEIKAVIAVFAAVFAALEETGQERFLP
jgi:hypothetical protein